MDTYCRACRKAYNQEYYQRTKERHNPGRYARRIEDRRAVRKLFIDYLSDKSCTDCGESDIVTLEFDHLRDKTANVSFLVARGFGWQTILNEIAKCEIVCANCHRRRTAKSFGWLKGR